MTENRGHCSEGGEGWCLSSSLFSKTKTLILERLEHLKNSWFLDATCLSDSLAFQKRKSALKRKVLSNISFPFPFPQSSQKREWVIPRFPFPQDLREWPSLWNTAWCFWKVEYCMSLLEKGRALNSPDKLHFWMIAQTTPSTFSISPTPGVDITDVLWFR